MKANLEDIASAAGVSKMTVSRVLRGGSGFSDDTRDRVLQVAERLGYIPNRLAAAFGSDQASTLVGMCVPRLTSGLFGHVLDGVDRALSRLGFQLMIGATSHSTTEEEAWVRQVASWRPAGLILSGRTHTPATVDLLRKSGMPVVEIWDLTTSPIDMAVGFSHFDCGAEMGQHLIRRGRRRAGFVGALARADVMGAARLDGFRAALAEGGVPLADQEVLHDAPGFYAGYYGLETLLSRRADLDAVYFHNDEMAIGGLAFCRRAGCACPRTWDCRLGRDGGGVDPAEAADDNAGADDRHRQGRGRGAGGAADRRRGAGGDGGADAPDCGRDGLTVRATARRCGSAQPNTGWSWR